MSIKLTIESIDNAMKQPFPATGKEFHLDPNGEAAQIVEEATRRGYIRRISHTQVEWTEAGLAKARAELEPKKTIELTVAEIEVLKSTLASYVVKYETTPSDRVRAKVEIAADLHQKLMKMLEG